jgi:hypothetical protein
MQQDALFLNFIIDNQLYMFRTDLLPIIRILDTVFTAIGICYTTSSYVEWGPLMVTQWLRCCATNRKVAGLIPDGVIGIFY